MKIPETLLLLVSIIFEKNAAEETTLLLKESWRDHNARFLLLILSSIIYKVNYDYQLMKIQFNKKGLFTEDWRVLQDMIMETTFMLTNQIRN